MFVQLDEIPENSLQDRNETGHNDQVGKGGDRGEGGIDKYLSTWRSFDSFGGESICVITFSIVSFKTHANNQTTSDCHTSISY